jgi:hypothetical protein
MPFYLPLSLSKILLILHCKEIPLMYSFSGNCAASVLISTFMSDLYIPRIGPHISLQQNRQADPGNI